MSKIKSTREFLLKEKLLGFREKVRVFNENEEELGYFKGKLIKIGNTYRLYEYPDEENGIFTISEKAISMRAQYRFYRGGEKDDSKLIGTLKRKLVSIKPKYWFEDPEGNELFTMKGKVFALTYKLYYKGNEVAQISKKLFKIRGTYGVKIDESLDDEDVPLVLGIVVMLHHEKEENR